MKVLGAQPAKVLSCLLEMAPEWKTEGSGGSFFL